MATNGEAVPLEDVRELITSALLALLVGDVGAISLFTEDVIGDGPNISVRSRTELEFQLLDRTGALTSVEFTLDRLDVEGSDVHAAWRVSADHTGAVMFNEDEFFEPSGQRMTATASTRFVLRDGRIQTFRTTCDRDPFDQLRRGAAE